MVIDDLNVLEVIERLNARNRHIGASLPGGGWMEFADSHDLAFSHAGDDDADGRVGDGDPIENRTEDAKRAGPDLS